MEPSPVGRKRKVTDAELRECIQAQMKPADIARRFNCSEANVSQRVKRLNLTTACVVTAPEESRQFVRRSVDVMEQLAKNAARANLLMDACHEWLTDADDPTRYNLEARAGEIEVTYLVEVRTDSGFRTLKRKKKLDELLGLLEGRDDDGSRFCGVEKGEYKHADPRELILKTQQETRSTVALIIDATQKLIDARILADFRTAVIEEVAKESPDCADRIAERVHRSIVLHAAFAGSGALSSGEQVEN